MDLSVQDSDITINSGLLREVARRRLRSWIGIGPLIFALAAAYQLFWMPQQYTSTVSISVQQTGSASMSPWAALTGQTDSKKYIGILHSRLLAEEVEDRLHLQQFYHIPTRRKTLEMLMASVKPDDNATEGLLFLDVTLPGPPRFAANSAQRTDQVKQLVAQAANAYVDALRKYYATSDNTRDSVLLNAAAQELHKAHAQFDEASGAVREFVRNLRHVDTQATPTSANESLTGQPSALEDLYKDELKLEARIRAEQAAETTAEAGITKQLGALSSLPTDDLFLRTARERLARAQRDYNHLVDAEQLANDNPRVVSAAAEVRFAQQELKKEIQGYKRHLTTQRLEADTNLNSMLAQRDTLLSEIRMAENRVPTRRELTVELAQLQLRQDIALASVKAAETNAAQVRMTSVSGNSRLSVVDDAIAPEIGQPGLIRVVTLSLFLAALLLALTIGVDYVRQSRKHVAIAKQLGEANQPLPLPAGETAETARARV